MWAHPMRINIFIHLKNIFYFSLAETQVICAFLNGKVLCKGSLVFYCTLVSPSKKHWIQS
jgi:hypothetical protein